MIQDHAEREAALDPSQSFIVQAPAGSGKTGLLVQRYLRLLRTVDRPESIVAMTFTRKAAAEMTERIHDALSAAREQRRVEDGYGRRTRDLAAQALLQDARHGWRLLDDSGRLQIQTIDSLCAMLVRQMPVISQFGAMSEVVENATELYRLAARRTLHALAEAGQDQDLLRRLAIYFDNDLSRLERLIVSMLEQRDQWTFLEQHDHPPEIEAFCRVLRRAHDALIDVFRDRRVVDFTEVTRAAIRALGTGDQPSDLLYRLDYRIQHLLVDEFQDTSLAQYDLIKALTAQWSDGDGHTLFVVGDPMQSIYRFRGAEVGLFLRCWEQQQLGAVRLTPLSLRTNFRCSPEIVRWVEEKFRPLMLADEAGDVSFRESAAAREPTAFGPEVIPFIEDSGELEANAVVDLVRREQAKGTVAILVRSRAHVESILPLLRRGGIAYEAVEIAALSEQQHVLDLISLTRAILHVGDRVSWLGCLRAPWCGLAVSDLSALAEPEPDRTIVDLLSDGETIARLSPEGRRRALGLHSVLQEAVARAARVPLRGLVESAWLALGGPAVLSEPNQREDIATVLDLIESSETGGVIRDFSLLTERLEGLFAQPGSAQGRVQVMTIFQAKGLEFGTVIVPELDKQTRIADRELLAWTDDIGDDGMASLRVAAKPRKGDSELAYDKIVKELDAKDLHELKRVLYVACTRAKNHLYLLGNVKLKKEGTLATPAKGTFLRLLWENVQQDFEAKRRMMIPQQRAERNGAVLQTVLRRVRAGWQPPRLDPSVAWQPQVERSAASARKVIYEWVSHTSRHVGIVVHALLNQLSTSDGEKSTAYLQTMRPAIESELRRLGVPSAEILHATAQVVRAVDNTLSSERGRWILKNHHDAHSEWAIGGRIGNTLISGTVDRSFRDERGRLWIIDFKTSEHEGGRLETFLEKEQRRYRGQLENYATLLARMTDSPVMMGLYFPLLDGWREWEFERQAALFASYTEE
ncbi:MAG: UvrD-helicase domain-containing protein [Acidobacteriaceae bacterium]|nr:UvrD-helicase domain-containing protein [Acidobacteriaceae bacterium]